MGGTRSPSVAREGEGRGTIREKGVNYRENRMRRSHGNVASSPSVAWIGLLFFYTYTELRVYLLSVY